MGVLPAEAVATGEVEVAEALLAGEIEALVALAAGDLEVAEALEVVDIEAVEALAVGEVEALAVGEVEALAVGEIEFLPADGIIAIIQGSMKRNRILSVTSRGENSRNLHQNFICYNTSLSGIGKYRQLNIYNALYSVIFLVR
ncbi:hypothetical protein AVEN_208292-1 [Araneus ventricosus]|uniref:Uncharacterized protein n=1 Tax=Araneus ventricosus TaxID=182803 RepID=A0A4Y2E152_ARAVE|nr:hypothetical protein AVEN_208292-1 [Araneus ventricosus]